MAFPFCSSLGVELERGPDVDLIVDGSDATLTTPEDTSAETSSTDESFIDDILPTEVKSDQIYQKHDAFHRWRPRFHLLAAGGWMNDPCAPGYDTRTGLYHVNFQWNPKGISWGNMSWGSAQSPDLVRWTVSKFPSITPTTALDPGGVFTGCTLPETITNSMASSSMKLTAFYTSAQKLPISYRIPYTRGSEQLALATSPDNGRTWERIPNNILLTEPPPDYDITSWRDPFVDSWEALDTLLDDGKQWLYGTLSGGLRGQTPTVFLYRINPINTAEWSFLSPLVDMPLNYSPSRWSGDFGVNWEVSNFLTLRDEDGAQHQVLITSAEGTIEDPAGGALSKDHRQRWMCGMLQKTETGQPKLKYGYGGTLDHGSFYAANGFWDSYRKHFVTIGWVFEEDLPQPLVEGQGWSGCLSIPRIVALKTWKGVVGTLRSELSTLSCFEDTLEEDGTHTMRTVSAMPDPRLKSLRCSRISESDHSKYFFTKPCSQWELEAVFEVSHSALRVGFDIIHSTDNTQYTRVYFEPKSETLIVNRENSTIIEEISTKTRSAPHTLFTIQQGGTEQREALRLHVYFDASVLEVFANDRTALTTRVYPDAASGTGSCLGVRLFAETESNSTEQPVMGHEMFLRSCNLWELDGAVSLSSQ